MSEIVKFREFMTTWHTSTRPEMGVWSDRNKANLIHSATSTRRVPEFRAFDLLPAPNSSLILMQNQDHRIGVESVCGAQEMFVRHVDFDTVYFQFCGTTALETEFGEYTMAPGEVMFIPEGIAHRSTGSADSLRWFAFANTPFTEWRAENDMVSHTEFEVKRVNGPDWKIPAGAAQPIKGGKVREKMICWDDKPDDLTMIERDYDYLVGVTSLHIHEKISGIRKLRAFDLFTEITGKKGAPRPIFRSPYLDVKTYNITGEQFAFHRALRTEEVRIQFRGEAMDMSEIENQKVIPGEVTIIPRGIAHSVITIPPESRDFLRFNFYSSLPWSYPSDFTRHYFHSRFEVKTTVHKQAAWLSAAE